MDKSEIALELALAYMDKRNSVGVAFGTSKENGKDIADFYNAIYENLHDEDENH